MTEWLQAGVQIVIVVDPSSNRRVKVHRAVTGVMVLTGENEIEGADVVPGWSCPCESCLPECSPSTFN